MKKKSATALGTRLLKASDHTDWKIQWSPAPPSECLHHTKKLLLYEGLLTNPWWYIKEAIIHEIAHIDQRDGEAKMYGGHGVEFFQRYGWLLVDLASAR